MDASEQRIRVYQKKDGKRPFSDWLNKLRDRKAQERIDARLTRVQLSNFGDAKAVGEGVLELRIDYGPGYRVYFGRDGNTVVILLLGGDKRTQSKDIDTAKKYWADYKARKTGKKARMTEEKARKTGKKARMTEEKARKTEETNGTNN